MDWFYHAYGDTLYRLVSRFYWNSKGNVSLSTSVLPINLILQVVLLPVYLLILAGTIESIPISTLIESIFIVLVIPFAFAHLTRFLLRKICFKQQSYSLFRHCSNLLLSLAIMAMFASEVLIYLKIWKSFTL